MAEAFLNHVCGEQFSAQSAGIEPGKLNPVVVEAMREVGIDISRNQTKSVQSFIDAKTHFDYVITVCDETSAERCPVFPGRTKSLCWSFPDLSALDGTPQEKLAKAREVRDMIRAKVQTWCDSTCGTV